MTAFPLQLNYSVRSSKHLHGQFGNFRIGCGQRKEVIQDHMIVRGFVPCCVLMRKGLREQDVHLHGDQRDPQPCPFSQQPSRLHFLPSHESTVEKVVHADQSD